MPKLNLSAIPQTHSTGYPEPYARAVEGRYVRRLAGAAGLTDFGVSQVVLKPGAWSSQRHWHEDEDEFLVLVAVAAVLVDDGGRTPLAPGDCVAFPKGDGNGHHIINEGDTDAVFVVVGAITNGTVHYSDIDMVYEGATRRYLRRDGTEFGS